jgi:hypothetical protein
MAFFLHFNESRWEMQFFFPFFPPQPIIVQKRNCPKLPDVLS